VSVTAPKGFVAAGVACGIKPNGDLDLSLVATADGHPVPAAAVFTTNRSTAAPVVTTRSHLEQSGGQAAAVILNSGNANASTGAPGRADAERAAALVADEIGCRPHHVLVCSTGLIGIPLPMEVLASGIPPVARSLRADGADDAAEAILTTDTVRKEVVVRGSGFTVGGMAKGAAMLAPDMATMLAVLTTDAAVEPEVLHEVLLIAIAESFNTLSIDGCTSTNDTVILLASGAAGPADPNDLADAVTEACADLAAQMAGDAEGATKVVRVGVVGAASTDDAPQIDLEVDLGLGDGNGSILTNDLTHAYVDENMGTS